MNIFTDPLESLTFKALLAILEATKDEGQRIDFKAQLDAAGERELAEDACAFANAYGGIIVIGVKDPKKTGGVVTFNTSDPPEVGDERHLAISNRILTLTYPPVSAEVASVVERGSTGRRAVIVRIKQSVIPPHEYIPHHSLVVRRGSRKAPLSLPEIEALLKRREFSGVRNGVYEREYPNIQYGPAMADSFGDHVGVTVRPQYVLRSYADFGRDDEDVIREFTRTMQGAKFKYRPLEEGLIAGESASAQFVDVAAAGFAFEARGDGRITVRMELGWRKGPQSDVEDVALALLFGCELSRRLYYRWEYSPQAPVHVGIANRTRRSRIINALPDVYDGSFEVDLSSGELHCALARIVERVWRSAGSNPRRSAVEKMVNAVSADTFRDLGRTLR